MKYLQHTCVLQQLRANIEDCSTWPVQECPAVFTLSQSMCADTLVAAAALTVG